MTSNVPALLGDEQARGADDAQTASEILNGTSRRELIDRIVAAYDVDRERAAEGADLYLRQLRGRRVLAEY